MINFTARNMKVFFKDKASVFFAFLSVIIIFALYALFLGDIWVSNISEIPNARYIMDSWICAGMLAVTSLTATMGAFGIVVEDKYRKIYKDFYASPVKKYQLLGGYLLAAVVIGIILTLVTLVFSEIYIVAYGGKLFTVTELFEVLGLIILSTLANTSIMFFFVSFFASPNAFSTGCTIIGTLCGFLTGIYLPVGMLPEAVQYIIKVFPPSHAAVLMRQAIMERPLAEGFAGAPAKALEGYKSYMGVTFTFGNYTMPAWQSILILAGSAILFYALAVIIGSRKQRIK